MPPFLGVIIDYNIPKKYFENDGEFKSNYMSSAKSLCQLFSDKCEMVCGGCGQSFDVCDFETLNELKKQP